MANSPQVLIEHVRPDVAQVLVQERAMDGSKPKQLWIEGIFGQANVQNLNGRVYPLNEMKRAVDVLQLKLKQSNGILGELDHPQSLQINLPLVSHVITELRVEGDRLMGKARILCGDPDIETPYGKIAGSIIRAGVQLGVSTRGTGVVNESNGQVSEFELKTVDIVADPSAPDALPKSIMESLEYARNFREVTHVAEQIREDQRAQMYLEAEIRKAIGELVEKGLFKIRK